MIKCFYLTSLILILSSCNGFSINRDSVSSIMSIFSDPGKKYYVSKELFDQSQYSFARVSFGNNVAIIVLVEEDSFGRQHWISSDGMKFITFNGKLVNTIGLNPDLTIHRYNHFAAIQNSRLILPMSASKPDLYNAKLIYESSSSVQVSYNYLGTTLDAMMVNFQGEVPSIRMKFQDSYILYNDKVIQTRQVVNFITGKSIEIEFYYK